MITQVAGRTGRGQFGGKVFLQTYNPEHFSVKCAAAYDFPRFYREELNIRKAFHYPPFVKLIHLSFAGKKEEEVYSTSNKIANHIKYILKSKGHEELEEMVLGPNAAVVYKINQKYRYQILLKGSQEDFALLKAIVKYLFIKHKQKFIPKTVTTGLDTNPFYMM